VLFTVIAVVISPILIVVAALGDLIQRRRRMPRLRLLVLVVGALIIETVGLAVAFITWILSGFGYLGSERWRWHLYRGYMGWYTNSLLHLITRVIGTRVEWRDHGDLSSGPVVLLARHTSFFDALIPATVLCRRNKLLAHHVVTHGLRYSPCIDVVGHRFPNRFIRRSPGEGSSELTHIEQVGTVLDQRSAAIIFPEGTFRNDDRFERVVRRLRRRRPDLADRAMTLDHVLPPRSNGTYALVQGAPTADIVICTNTGFETFGSIASILGRPYTDKPIVVETWRIARDQIPEDAESFNDWLFDQYVSIDEWVTRNAT